MLYADSEGSEQHVHPCCMIWSLSVRRRILYIDSVSAQRRPSSACAIRSHYENTPFKYTENLTTKKMKIFR